MTTMPLPMKMMTMTMEENLEAAAIEEKERVFQVPSILAARRAPKDANIAADVGYFLQHWRASTPPPLQDTVSLLGDPQRA
jgi:hypothetical protein